MEPLRTIVRTALKPEKILSKPSFHFCSSYFRVPSSISGFERLNFKTYLSQRLSLYFPSNQSMLIAYNQLAFVILINQHPIFSYYF